MIFTLRPLQLSLQERIGHSPFYLCLATSASMDNVWNIFSIYIMFSFQLDSTCSIWSWLSTLYSLIFAILQLQTLLMSPLFEVWSWNTEAPPWPSCKSTRSKISFTSSVANILPKKQLTNELWKFWKDLKKLLGHYVIHRHPSLKSTACPSQLRAPAKPWGIAAIGLVIWCFDVKWCHSMAVCL